MKKYTILCHYVDAFKNTLVRQGVDPKPLLKSSGIKENVALGPNARVPSDSFVSFMHKTMLTLKDEYFGLVSPALPIGTFYYGSHTMIAAPTLGKALELGVGYYQIISNACSIKLILTDEEVEFRVKLTRPELDPDHLLAEFILTAWLRFSSWLIGKNILLKKVCFDYAIPAHEAEYHYLFPALREFNQPALSLHFSKEFLTLPIVKNIKELEDYFGRSFEYLLLKPINDDSLSAKIRLLIEDYEDNNFPTFDVVADVLCMAPTTLRLKLKKEGVSYQIIKNILRRDTAIHHLTNQHYSVTEIAQKTGFSEPSGFVRAFKNWTGLTPAAYREQDE
jgi:AraC-like DNA-binding protein